MESNTSCQYCLKTFKRASSLFSHMCNPKRRFNARSEKSVKLAMVAFGKFYQYTHNRITIKNFDDFDKSPYYNGFVKFGHYMVNTHCINTEEYTKWVLKSGIRLDSWAKYSTYYILLE